MDYQTEFTETTACTLCGSEAPTPYRICSFRIREGLVDLGLNHCSCGMRFTSPRLNTKGLEYLYNEGYKTQTVSGTYNTEDEVSVAEYESFYGYAREQLPKGGRLLDVGCGVGLLLDRFAQDSSIKAEGIEFSQYAVDSAREKGHEVQVGLIENDPFPAETFDAVTSLYVLEHVPNPLDVIGGMYRALKPGGKLMISVPNYRYLRLRGDNPIASAILGDRATIHPEEHLQNYTPVTISQMLTTSGFRVLETHAARPLNIGSPLVKLAKKTAYLGLSVLARLGYNMIGIHIIAERPHDSTES